ncbi:hypothetical protein DQQ10_09345 [Pseudochryseolinea flava]|uniref:Xaa-Pro dipeptidyl-peptidase-like domain-containing protein n=1 Tax=Pseudochryseolinea flava TaxID=2059302 RepID=A0A364Y6W2_9BACT|nr:hypothetical protein DQQ10_09345 [Pseudochryseolinea flava]
MDKILLIVGVALLSSFGAIAQEHEFKVGFKVISAHDSSRQYKPSTTSSHKLHYRPIEIDLWYPADVLPTDSIVSFSNLISLLEERCKYFDDTKIYQGLTEEMLQYICGSLNCSDHDILKSVNTTSYLNAPRVDIPFPLIVYFAGFNGMSYENYLLLELLAKKGFIVASVSSIGRYPGNMTMQQEDIMEQVKDAEYVIEYLTNAHIASDQIGLVGYSWGGLAATILAMKDSSKFKAIVSLDGSEQFSYADAAESSALNEFRTADYFTPQSIQAPFLYLDSDISTLETLPDSIYNLVDDIRGDKTYVKIDNATHEDFSSLSVVLSEDRSKTPYAVIQTLATNFFLDKLKGENVFFENIPKDGVAHQFSPPQVTTSRAETKMTLRFIGTIRDNKSNAPLAYANIGILNREIGTTSNSSGEFEIPFLESNVNDTIKVSMIGYEPTLILLDDIFKKLKTRIDIQLQQRDVELNEVVVTEKKLTTKILGNTTDSKFFGGKFASGDLGSEIAIRIKVKKSPTYLDAFSFNISYNTEDSAMFRVNVYEVVNGLPGRNMLRENIFIKVKGETGKMNVDLLKYNIVVTGDFFIGLEWVEGDRNAGIVFSSGFINKGTYYRKASQGRWKKFPMGVGFNVTAKY